MMSLVVNNSELSFSTGCLVLDLGLNYVGSLVFSYLRLLLTQFDLHSIYTFTNICTFKITIRSNFKLFNVKAYLFNFMNDKKKYI